MLLPVRTIKAAACLSLFYLALFNKAVFGQTPSIDWGDVQDVKKGTNDMAIVHSDETGLYMLEGHSKLKAYFVIGAVVGTEFKLMKFDNQFNEVYEAPLKEVLQKYELQDIYVLGNELYLFAHRYDKDAGAFSIMAGKIDKKTGDVPGGLKEVAAMPLASKRDDLIYQVRLTADKSAFMLMMEATEDKEKSVYTARVEPSLKKTKPRQFKLPDEATYEISDIQHLRNNFLLVQAKEYSYEDIGKKNPVRTFKGVAIDIFNESGKKVKSLPVLVKEKYIVYAQLVVVKNKWFLAGSYCNTAKKDEIHGLFTARIDSATLDYAQVAITPISQAMLGSEYQESAEKEKTKKEKRKDDDHKDDGLNRNFGIRKLSENPDGGMTIVAERAWRYSYTVTTTSSSASGAMRTRITTYTRDIAGEMMLLKTKADGTVVWISVLPKKQIHLMQGNYGTGISLIFRTDHDAFWPMFHSTGLFEKNNHLYIIFNDNPANENVLKPGDKVKEIDNMVKGDGFIVDCDLNTGEFKRYRLTDEKKDPTMMPRFGFTMEDTYIIPAMRANAYGQSKGELRFGTLKM